LFKSTFQPNDVVKTCCKLESGLNLAYDGLRACTRGVLMPPLFCKVEDINNGIVTKEFIIDKRKRYIEILNDNHTVIDCKNCSMVEKKKYSEITFDHLGHIDLQHYSICNLRCSYCLYTKKDTHVPPQYDALKILKLFSKKDIEWNSHVDFAGGEPTLLNNLNEYLDFFKSQRIRIMMYSNGVKFNQLIFDNLKDGSIYTLITSLDAGTPTTFNKLKGRNYFVQVLDNLNCYSIAGNNEKGMLTVKYIFCHSNCNDDDIVGFAYAMLTIRPQQIWLTFDFSPLTNNDLDYDYSKQIKAYAKLYLMLKKFGIEAFHYYKEAIATVSENGKKIMTQILTEIKKQNDLQSSNLPNVKFRHFQSMEKSLQLEVEQFSLDPFCLIKSDGYSEKFDFSQKRILLIPASPTTIKLLNKKEIASASWVGFVDRNPIQQGKKIGNKLIYSYEAIKSLNVDFILTIPPEKHRNSILHSIALHAPKNIRIIETAPYCSGE